MQVAAHIRKIPQNPYRGIRSHAATLAYDFTHEESRVLPESICEEARRVIKNLSRAQVAGDPSVRELVAQTYPHEISVERVALVPGAKYGLRITLESIVNPGDEVLVPDPGYPLYTNLVHLVRGVPRPYPLTQVNKFQISYETLLPLITPNTKAIILNSPALPMGTVFSPGTLEIVADVARKYDLAVISDEVLKTLSEITAASIALLPEMSQRTVVVESISKRFLLAQWRAGWLILPPELIKPVGYILANGASLPQDTQAVLAILLQHEHNKDSWVWGPRAELVEKRDKALSVISRTPLFSCVKPVAGNWLFPYIVRRFDGATLTETLAKEKRIGVFPGMIFGMHGKQHIAISYAQREEVLERGLTALEKICEILDSA